MPISREQFNKGLDKTQYEVLKCLTNHPDQAFELREIAEATHNWTSPNNIGSIIVNLLELFAIWGILESLRQGELVDKKMIGGSTYYSIHQG